MNYAERDLALQLRREKELRGLSEQDALEIIDSLLNLGTTHGWRRPASSSEHGMVRRQKLLYQIKDP